MGQFLQELKRRNVFRVAVAYVVASWLVLQVADIVLQGIEAPSWVMKVFMLVVALGFPLVLLFSWAYELTPEGLKKEKEVDRSASITPETGRKLDLITIGMLVAVVVVVVIDRTVVHDHTGDVAPEPAAALSDRSIAVLAFEDLSPDGDQAYFAEGLSEELLNVLAKRGDLQVAGRTSSFAFKGQQKDLREIGELLNVAHILEGSVRKSGNRIRVTAQLIKANDGFHLFSETYDRELSDVFEVQDEIAEKISSALLTEIVGTEAAVSTTTDTEAYELFLMARQRIHSRDILNLREASTMLDRALEIDPIYAPALAQKALVTYLMSDSLGAYGDIPIREALPVAQKLVDQALALDGRLAEAHAVKGLLLDQVKHLDEAIASLRRALELNPTMSDAANWLASVLASKDDWAGGRAVLEDIVERDPTYGPAFNNLTMDYARTSEYDTADGLISRVERIVGDNDDVRMSKGALAIMRGNTAEGVRQIRYSYDLNPSSTVLKMWYGFGLIGLADFETLRNAGLPSHRMLALAATGSREELSGELERFVPESAFIPRALGEIGMALVSLGENRKLIDFVQQQWGSVDDLLEAEPTEQAWGTGYLGPLAYACRSLGDTETADVLLRAMREDLDSDDERMSDNWLRVIGEARYAALTGQPEVALAELKHAVGAGLRSLLEIDSPIYDDVRSVHGFAELDARLRGLVNDERARLGMPAYHPVPVTEERREAPAYVN